MVSANTFPAVVQVLQPWYTINKIGWNLPVNCSISKFQTLNTVIGLYSLFLNYYCQMVSQISIGISSRPLWTITDSNLNEI